MLHLRLHHDQEWELLSLYELRFDQRLQLEFFAERQPPSAAVLKGCTTEAPRHGGNGVIIREGTASAVPNTFFLIDVIPRAFRPEESRILTLSS